MTRVSENSNTAALKHAVNRAKLKMENLNLKGATLKNVTRPSDDPTSNVEALSLGSVIKDNQQYQRNINYALIQLNSTEQCLEQLTDLLVKAKEVALAQSSDFYNRDIRQNVSNEIRQIYNQVLAIANKRVGVRYIFGGYSSLKPPFSADGQYRGDDGKIRLEVSKDFFIPINLAGSDVFFAKSAALDKSENPLDNFRDVLKSNKTELRPDDNTPPSPEEMPTPNISRDLASVDESNDNRAIPQKDRVEYDRHDNLFTLLSSLVAGLENDDSKMIQHILEKFDDSISRIITLRTRIGSISNSVNSAQASVENESVSNAALQNKLVDADVADLFSEITKQQEILKTSYKVGQGLVNTNLLDFLK